ncbi:MAG TPA: sugar phosphate isomerase/epimerase family protein [Sumerlaeia bacterium]|nr:sugar phosphate isomerase/epimerase family protein [Sumerlaeia bacterium]
MKFGAHTYVFTDRWSDDCLRLLDLAKQLGLDCIEIGVGDDVPFSPALTRRRAGELGLDLAVSPGGLWPLECDLSSDEDSEREAGLAWHKRQVDLAAELGAVAYCGSIYGHTGVVKRRRPPPEEFPRTAAALRQLAEYGKEQGVAIVLEPMSHFRTHVVNTPEQVMRLIALADHPNLGVLLDTYHLITEVRDYAAAIQTVGKRLWGLHACESDRGVPGGGLVPWDAVFEALRGVDFDGHAIMETYNSSLRDFSYERGMFHNVCPDPAAFVKEGLRFLKEGLGRSASD